MRQTSRQANFVTARISEILCRILTSAFYIWKFIQALSRLCRLLPRNLWAAAWKLNTHTVTLPIFTTTNSTYFLSSAFISQLAHIFSKTSLHQKTRTANTTQNVSTHWQDVYRNDETLFVITGRYRRSAGWRPVWGLAVQPIRNPKYTATQATTRCWLAAIAGPPGDGKHIGLDTLTSTL